MIETKITCDNCKTEIKPHEHMNISYLSVTNEQLKTFSSIMYAIKNHRIVDRDMHFCSLYCIKEWISQFNPPKPLL